MKDNDCHSICGKVYSIYSLEFAIYGIAYLPNILLYSHVAVFVTVYCHSLCLCISGDVGSSWRHRQGL